MNLTSSIQGTSPMQPKHPWLQKCLEKLEKLPQIRTTTTVEPFYIESAIADGLLTIHTPEKKLEYIIEIKSHLTHETLDIAVDYINHLRQRLSNGRRVLLVTDILSDALVNELLTQNIEFIDTTGNIYLNNSSVYILINSSVLSSKKASSANKITTSTLKVTYALLQDPKILKALTEDIAEVTGVDLNAVKDSLESLYELNYLQRQTGGKYRIENYTKLLERWEMGYVENLRPELLINTFSPIGNLHFLEISNKIIEIAYPHKILIGGEFGAALITGYLKPISTVLHIPDQENYRVITTKLRLKPDLGGSISILKQFGNKNEYKDCQSKPVVDPLLIHAELALHPDERLKETASRIYEQHIAKRQQIAEIE